MAKEKPLDQSAREASGAGAGAGGSGKETIERRRPRRAMRRLVRKAEDADSNRGRDLTDLPDDEFLKALCRRGGEPPRAPPRKGSAGGPETR